MEDSQKHAQDIGPFNMAALIEYYSNQVLIPSPSILPMNVLSDKPSRNRDITPPEIPAGKASIEGYYPYTELALHRIYTLCRSHKRLSRRCHTLRYS